jgi:hypothetical protein
MVERITTFTCKPCSARPTHALIEGLGMAYLNGAKRIKRLGLGIAVVGALLLVPLSLIPLYAKRSGGDGFGFFVTFLFLLGLPLFFGGVVYLFGWFLEGLLRPSANHR